MRALALAALALGACWPPRGWAVRAVVGGIGGVCLLASVWQVSFAGQANDWAAPVVVVLAAAAVVGMPALPAAAALFGVRWQGWRWLMLCGSAAAVYACVPETDQMREVAVVLVAGAVAEWLRGVPLPAPAFVAAWGLVGWSALFGATGRPSAVIGGLFAIVAPLASSLLSRRGDAAAVLAGLVWAVIALIVARTGGIESSTGPAVAAAVVGAAVATALSALVWCRCSTARSGG